MNNPALVLHTHVHPVKLQPLFQGPHVIPEFNSLTMLVWLVSCNTSTTLHSPLKNQCYNRGDQLTGVISSTTTPVAERENASCFYQYSITKLVPSFLPETKINDLKATKKISIALSRLQYTFESPRRQKQSDLLDRTRTV